MPTLLVVDDDESVQKILVRFVSFHELIGLHAFSIKEAKAFLADPTNHIDGILVDGMNGAGVPFVKELREKGFRGPIIACSADEDTNTAMVRVGADIAISGINKSEGITLFLKVLETRSE